MENWLLTRSTLAPSVYDRQHSMAEALITADMAYPHAHSEVYNPSTDNVLADSIAGKNYKAFLKVGRLTVKKLNKKLRDGAKIESDNFSLHLGFIDKWGGKKYRYYPMSLLLEDGQMLIGLARQTGADANKAMINRSTDIFIDRWYLNGANITKQVFKGDRDETKELLRIATIINGIHTKFVKKDGGTAEDKEIRKLTKERDALILELQGLNEDIIEEDIPLNEEDVPLEPIVEEELTAVEEELEEEAMPLEDTPLDKPTAEKQIEVEKELEEEAMPLEVTPLDKANELKEKILSATTIDNDIIGYIEEIEELFNNNPKLEATALKEISDHLENLAGI